MRRCAGGASVATDMFKDGVLDPSRVFELDAGLAGVKVARHTGPMASSGMPEPTRRLVSRTRVGRTLAAGMFIGRPWRLTADELSAEARASRASASRMCTGCTAPALCA